MDVKIIRELAEEHEVSRQTIREIIRKKKLRHVPVKHSGVAKGYDAAAQAIIARALEPEPVGATA